MCEQVKAMGAGHERLRKGAALCMGAAAYALLYALGSQIDRAGATAAGTTLVRFALAFPAALAVLAALFRFAMPRLVFQKTDSRGGGWLFPVCVFAFLAACYLAMLLVHYPGSFMYDTQRQVFQVARGEYEMFHPLLHTLLIRLCLSMYGVLQSYEKCAALYSLIQLTLMALCFSQACASMYRMCGRKPAVLSALFFGLYPAHLAFSANCTKDGLFSAFFALFLTLCFERAVLGNMPKGRMALILAAGVLSCLLRNNMVYALLVWSVMLALSGRRFRVLMAAGLMAVVLSVGANGVMQRATDAADGSRIEMLSVPIQQLARAKLYAPQCFDAEDAALMDLVFVDARYGTEAPLYTRYEPTLADPVKNDLDEALVLSRFGELMRLWARVGAKCPGVYLDAFLNMALPSLYPYSEYRVVQPYIETGLQPGVVTEPFGQPPMTQPARFAPIRDWMYTHIFATGADDVPVVRLLFNTGMVFWLLLLIVVYEVYSGSWTRLALLMLPVLLWGTYLLGPVMQGRYLYPFICVLPVFIFRRANDGRGPIDKGGRLGYEI